LETLERIKAGTGVEATLGNNKRNKKENAV
jgi:hypothetical protein